MKYVLVLLLLALVGCNEPLYTAEHRQHIKTQYKILSALQIQCKEGNCESCEYGLDLAVTTLEKLTKE